MKRLPFRVTGSLLALLIAGAGSTLTSAQDIPLEYQVKAAYLYHFVRFVEWPDRPAKSIKICVAGQNPFGSVLADLLRDERVRGMPIETSVILEPDPSCTVVFVPRTANTSAYLRAAAGMSTLTVGETPRFLEQGGIIRFTVDGTSVRFEINRDAAERSRLRISSRLLQLARVVNVETEEP